MNKQDILFLNFHTHQAQIDGQWALQNLYHHFELVCNRGIYSIGLHPWYIVEQKWQEELIALKKFSLHKNVLAIGECGLDKVCKTDFTLQQTVFSEQIQWANGIQKPLIIHCVRAWQEIFHLLIKNHNKVPVIFHGFNGKSVIAQEIISKGYYLSFGKALQHSNMQQLLPEIPINRLLLETDDADISIEDIYQTAATIFQIDIKSLSLQIEKNVKDIFGLNYNT